MLTPDNAICRARVDVALAGGVHGRELGANEGALHVMARIGHERGVLFDFALARVHAPEIFIAVVGAPDVGRLGLWGRHFPQIPELDGLIFAVGNEVPPISLQYNAR